MRASVLVLAVAAPAAAQFGKRNLQRGGVPASAGAGAGAGAGAASEVDLAMAGAFAAAELRAGLG